MQISTKKVLSTAVVSAALLIGGAATGHLSSDHAGEGPWYRAGEGPWYQASQTQLAGEGPWYGTGEGPWYGA